MKIVVLAGGFDQIALINELKRRGHQVVLVDYFQNPPARAYADKHIVASTLDVERVRDIVLEEKADLLCTACTDQALLTVANVSGQLGLPCYISYETALNVTNKSYMKRRMMECGIPTAKFIILDKMDLSRLSGFEYPLVVKPVDCNSSKGVKKVMSEEELVSALNDAMQFSRTGSAIVEEFKSGTEISADFYIENGQAKYLSATSSVKIGNRKSFTIMGSVYPAVTPEQKERICKVASQIAEGFDLDNCPLLIQLIVNGDKVDVIEFSARMGGGTKYKLIEVLSGVNIMSEYVDMILGARPSVNPTEMKGFCRMNYIYCNPGTLDRVEGLEELKRKGLIVDYFLYKTKGMKITASETSGDRAAGYLLIADSQEEMMRKVSLADSSVKVLSSEDEDIMIHNLM